MAIMTKSDTALAQSAIDNAAVRMFHCGQSWKCIIRELGLTQGQLARIRKQCGISPLTYRNGKGPLGTVVCARIKMIAAEDIKKFAASVKRLPPAK